MKKRFKIVGSLVLILLFAVVCWLIHSKTSPKAATTLTPFSPSATPAVPLIYKAPAKNKYQGMSDSRWEWWKQMEKRDPKFEWKMSISFYGKIVDQEGRPVEGAKIRFQWTDMSSAGTTEKLTKSDARGLFSLSNEAGKRLGVFVEKEGYHSFNHGRGSFEYAAFFEPIYHEPDPSSPVIFRMLKKSEAEPMLKRGPTLFGTKNDGTSTHFDLRTDRKVSIGSGDLAVQITKGPTTNNRFDWTATVEGEGGTALLESNDEFMVMAPTEGYQSQWSFVQKANNEHYQDQTQTKFYVKTGDGKYARVEMRIIPDYSQAAAVDLTIYLNPSGSRNLEFDPAKAVKSP